jgi:hypothetical protein
VEDPTRSAKGGGKLDVRWKALLVVICEGFWDERFKVIIDEVLGV